MNLNNSVTINDCITNLQTLEDFNSNIGQLKNFLATSSLVIEEKKELQSIINVMTMKNTKQKNTVHKTMNSLNKTGMY